MAQSVEGRRLHGLAADAREKGDSINSLKLDIEAMSAYAADNDYLGLAEIFAEWFLTARHLRDKTGFEGWLTIAVGFARVGVELAEKSGDKKALALPYYNLAKGEEELGDLTGAIGDYKKAIQNMENNPPEQHNRPGVLADMRAHLAEAEYENGDKSALERILQAISDLEESDEFKYNKDVWLSGAHMRLAELLKEDDLDRSREYLAKAKQIIDDNPDLTIRAQQWQKLADTFAS